MPDFEKRGLSAFVMFVAVLVGSGIFLVPSSAWNNLTSPETLACIGSGVFVVELLVLRFLPRRYLKIERFLYALFLASMPFVYVAGAYLSGSGDELVLECLGIPLFVGLAVYGYQKSCLVLALGIVAHGFGWDLWHHSRGTSVSSWYASACLLIDVAFGYFVFTQVGVQQASMSEPRPLAHSTNQ